MIEARADSLRLVEGGIIEPARSSHLSRRLAELWTGISDVIRALRPDVMIVEDVFSRTAYPKTALLMAHARGTLVCAAAMANIPVHDYAATSVKLALVGNGAATKAQVAAMVVHALRLRRAPAPADVTDALALAIAFCRRRKGSR